MGRQASGEEVLEQAKQILPNVKTVKELRQVQSVILPLTLNLSLKDTA
ncbi:transposase [Candidatus Magnetoovum chiemensis]|nr:transposase [Candidatus Magnetoovum chiemensis]